MLVVPQFKDGARQTLNSSLRLSSYEHQQRETVGVLSLTRYKSILVSISCSHYDLRADVMRGFPRFSGVSSKWDVAFQEI
jgi:hypothetical protein